MSKLIDLKISQLIRDLQGGMTRYKHEDQGWGSVETKYGMTQREVEVIFNHPKLKDVKTISIRFRLIDDVDTTVNTGEFEKEPAPPPTPTPDLGEKNGKPVTGKALAGKKTEEEPAYLDYL